MDLGISNEWCTHYKALFKTVKIEPIKDGVVHLHHSGAPKSITVLQAVVSVGSVGSMEPTDFWKVVLEPTKF